MTDKGNKNKQEMVFYRGVRAPRTGFHPFLTRNSYDKYSDKGQYDPSVGVPFQSLSGDEEETVRSLEVYSIPERPDQEQRMVKVTITEENFHLYKDRLFHIGGYPISSFRELRMYQGDTIRINGDNLDFHDLNDEYAVEIGQKEDSEWEFEPLVNDERDVEINQENEMQSLSEGELGN